MVPLSFDLDSSHGSVGLKPPARRQSHRRARRMKERLPTRCRVMEEVFRLSAEENFPLTSAHNETLTAGLEYHRETRCVTADCH